MTSEEFARQERLERRKLAVDLWKYHSQTMWSRIQTTQLIEAAVFAAWYKVWYEKNRGGSSTGNAAGNDAELAGTILLLGAAVLVIIAVLMLRDAQYIRASLTAANPPSGGTSGRGAGRLAPLLLLICMVLLALVILAVYFCDDRPFAAIPFATWLVFVAAALSILDDETSGTGEAALGSLFVLLAVPLAFATPAAYIWPNRFQGLVLGVDVGLLLFGAILMGKAFSGDESDRGGGGARNDDFIPRPRGAVAERPLGRWAAIWTPIFLAGCNVLLALEMKAWFG